MSEQESKSYMIPILDKIYLSNTWIINGNREKRHTDDIKYIRSKIIKCFIEGVENLVGSGTIELIDGYDEIKKVTNE